MIGSTLKLKRSASKSWKTNCDLTLITIPFNLQKLHKSSKYQALSVLLAIPLCYNTADKSMKELQCKLSKVVRMYNFF